MKKGTVMAFGTFDLLHRGHLHFFEQAKRLGGKLVVVVARDKTVEKVKGRKPVFNENERFELVKGLSIVDRALLGCRHSMYERIKEVKPAVIALGYDQKPSEKELKKELKERGLTAKVVRLKAFKPRTNKSSKIRKKILKAVYS
ncbi:MAG: adenylyltransferase/cytidyltransferase family protein [Candidatus Diapherotrites archaeon]